MSALLIPAEHRIPGPGVLSPTYWVAEITSLGCLVKGLWLVDWDSGDGFPGRVPIN